jgi:hypothetical protein
MFDLKKVEDLVVGDRILVLLPTDTEEIERGGLIIPTVRRVTSIRPINRVEEALWFGFDDKPDGDDVRLEKNMAVFVLSLGAKLF